MRITCVIQTYPLPRSPCNAPATDSSVAGLHALGNQGIGNHLTVFSSGRSLQDLVLEGIEVGAVRQSFLMRVEPSFPAWVVRAAVVDWRKAKVAGDQCIQGRICCIADRVWTLDVTVAGQRDSTVLTLRMVVNVLAIAGVVVDIGMIRARKWTLIDSLLKLVERVVC